MPAGYSGTPLAQKLGIKPGHRVALLGAPTGLVEELADLPDGVTVTRRAQGRADVIVSFHTERAELEDRVPALLDVLDVDGGLWIAWPKKTRPKKTRPKKASKVPTDVNDDTVREVFLPLGLVDNKVCAINDVWSGLRVVWRKEYRAGLRTG